MRNLGVHPGDRVAIALPDWPRFRALVGETEAAMRLLEVGLVFVRDDGTIDEVIPLG
jgi:hypothetical protein